MPMQLPPVDSFVPPATARPTSGRPLSKVYYRISWVPNESRPYHLQLFDFRKPEPHGPRPFTPPGLGLGRFTTYHDAETALRNDATCRFGVTL